MTSVGKTLLKGHALRDEGKSYFLASGHRGSSWMSDMQDQYAKCECGELFGPGWTQSAVKRIHRLHKDSLR